MHREAISLKSVDSVISEDSTLSDEIKRGKKSKSRLRNERSNNCAGPFKVARIVLLSVVLPVLCIVWPIALKQLFYNGCNYPIGVSDMRLADDGISTIWCQRQILVANTSFNAFLVKNTPPVLNAEPEVRKNRLVNMSRHFTLSDGDKEYWGFYLLDGTEITVSTCVRWPGASLFIVEGHGNLKHCAYMGDDSSEEKEDSRSSEEDRNITVMEKMTKLMPGVTLNYNRTLNLWNNHSHKYDKAVHLNAADRLNKTRPNLHLLYGEKVYNKTLKRSNVKKDMKNSRETFPENIPDEKVIDIMKKLDSMGNSGKAVQKKLNEYLRSNSNIDLRDFMTRLVEEIDSEDRQPSEEVDEYIHSKTHMDFEELKKEMLSLRVYYDNNDEDDAGEESVEEYQHHRKANKTAKNKDRSRSEEWSSFSSSEERMLQCKGLVTSLPLVPNIHCAQNGTVDKLFQASHINSLTYRASKNGYYFFIFNNENEMLNNFVWVHFSLNRTVYDTSSAVAACTNRTHCSLPLSFASDERAVFEIPSPTQHQQHLWNDEFIVTTRCEGRTSLFVTCMFVLPALFISLAFAHKK